LTDAEASDIETFATTAFAFDIGIAELESLIDSLLHEIDFGAVDQAQALGINDDLNPIVLKNNIICPDHIGVIDQVGVSGAAGLLYSNAKAYTMSPLAQETPDSFCRTLGQ
jgi:hypothetical protein